MTRRRIKLVCERCGKEFEAGARRRVVHCRECAEYLRRKGQGPLQIQKKTSLNQPRSGYIQPKEVCWTRAERDLEYYLQRFKRFQVYDCVTPPNLDSITDEDRQLANKIAARMSAETWKPILGQSIAQVGHWDLLSMSDDEWESRKQVIRTALSKLLRPGIGVARLTKALHRKRPRLIPICDNVVLKALGVYGGKKADTIIACMDRFREIGRKHISRLQKLKELSKQLQAEMTELRILELLYWVQFGPFSPSS